ncbi:MAG: protein-L-isoaspartate(D-aspartate) O-methyltransferase [Bacteroidales bacterium]|nr:protein-L-isoaspartate(D-aspartate) O-methyltransferase [Bacteroidales bacterium]
MIDTLKDKGLRKQMVEDLKRKGVDDVQILEAFNEIPRHFFVPQSLYGHAYEDTPLPIACKQTISQPYTVAMQTQLLEVSKNKRILEIGTGSGYQAVILKKLGAYVYTIERHKHIYEETKKIFEKLYFNIAAKYGDGYLGWNEFAPYDGIVVTCGAPEVPQKLLSQLKVGGIMVVPVGDNTQTMTKIIRVSEDKYETTHHGSFRFVPMVESYE